MRTFFLVLCCTFQCFDFVDHLRLTDRDPSPTACSTVFVNNCLGGFFIVEIDKDFGSWVANLSDLNAEETVEIEIVLLQIVKDILLKTMID